ncbi:peptidoglycan editing factor PgeF [Clostridium carnis]
MKRLTIKDLKRKRDYLMLELDNINVIFSTAEEGRSFNRNVESGVENLNSIKKDFNLINVEYLNQIHSDKVFIFENGKDVKREEGDALVTNEIKTAIGVFTADCVPVIIVNEDKKVIAAIHSGWKGTYNSITTKTLNVMKDKYDIDITKTKIFIGPHIRRCCYEVSNELKEKFLEHTKISEKQLFDGRNLSMEECILKDIRECGFKEENIYSLNLCTHCEKEIKLYSYRSSVGTYGRLFSFAYIK